MVVVGAESIAGMIRDLDLRGHAGTGVVARTTLSCHILTAFLTDHYCILYLNPYIYYALNH